MRRWLFSLAILAVAGSSFAQAGLALPKRIVSQAATVPKLAGCSVFPANNVWNTPIDHLPVDTRSKFYIDSIGRTTHLHPDFGSGQWNGGPIGIPFNIVASTQPKKVVKFTYAAESDRGPYPIPSNPKIEGGPKSKGDRHILMVDKDACKLYELWNAYPQADGTWKAGSGAIFDLSSNALRPAGWTSADAAGLPMLPGLVRYAEIQSGVIRHAIRFTAAVTQRKYIWPARHYASSNTSLAVPPMGQRFRLKSSFNVSAYPSEVQILLVAMQRYGLILADNGSNWYISGVPDARWNNDMWVSSLSRITGDDFEAVDESSLKVDDNSGATH